MVESDPNRTGALEAASQKRTQMKEAVSKTEIAAASPSSNPGWRDRLVIELDGLRHALDQHIIEVEGPDGLLAELTALAPRLSTQIEEVHDEHPGLKAQVDGTIDLTTSSEDVEEIRGAVLDTLIAISRHRQRGADLVYNGYSVDIGSG